MGEVVTIHTMDVQNRYAHRFSCHMSTSCRAGLRPAATHGTVTSTVPFFCRCDLPIHRRLRLEWLQAVQPASKGRTCAL